LSNLKDLENNSIYILREAYACFPKLFVLWSMGKDSSVLLWLIKKAFLGKVPFPVVHIDTTFKIEGMIKYRNELAIKNSYDLRYAINEEAISQKNTFPDGKIDRISCCKLLKTKPLLDFQQGVSYQYKLDHKTQKFIKVSGEKFDCVIVGLRSDEEGSRSKERYFSLRSTDSKWNTSNQPMELWDYYNTSFSKDSHIRAHPLLDWCELDIWKYIEQEKIPMIDLYFASKTDHTRYRSLGCANCSAKINSTAKNVSEVILELSSQKLKGVSERSGRGQDKEGKGTLEILRKDGYM
jgi:sulfate adenylyltransferase subunit 2